MQRKNIQGYSAPRPESAGPRGTGKMPQIPENVFRSVLCAAGLLALGLAMFVSGIVLWTTEGTTAMIGLWVCGLFVFIPGFYFSRLAYHAYKGTAGYSWADIPDWPAE